MKKFIMALTVAATFAVTGCKSTKDAAASLPVDMLTNTNWQLTDINGKAISKADFGNGAPTALFGADHKVAGKGGCNGYGGSWNLNDDGGMNISQVFSTKMFCENAKGENDYFKALEGVTAAKVEKNKLTLMKGVDAVLVFRPTEAN